MMNVNVSSRHGVRTVAAGHNAVIVVSAAEVAVREAAFAAAYRAATEEAPLIAMLHEALYVSVHAGDEKHRELLARAEGALRKLLAELEEKHKAAYEAAYAAAVRWGRLAEYKERVEDCLGDQDNSWIRYACRGLRVLAWARSQGIYPEIAEDEWGTLYSALQQASGGWG